MNDERSRVILQRGLGDHVDLLQSWMAGAMRTGNLDQNAVRGVSDNDLICLAQKIQVVVSGGHNDELCPEPHDRASAISQIRECIDRITVAVSLQRGGDAHVTVGSSSGSDDRPGDVSTVLTRDITRSERGLSDVDLHVSRVAVGWKACSGFLVGGLNVPKPAQKQIIERFKARKVQELMGNHGSVDAAQKKVQSDYISVGRRGKLTFIDLSPEAQQDILQWVKDAEKKAGVQYLNKRSELDLKGEGWKTAASIFVATQKGRKISLERSNQWEGLVKKACVRIRRQFNDHGSENADQAPLSDHIYRFPVLKIDDEGEISFSFRTWYSPEIQEAIKQVAIQEASRPTAPLSR